MILLACYHLIIFSDFVLDSFTQFIMGYSFIAVLMIVVLVNVAVVIQKQLAKYKRKKAILRRKRQKNHDLKKTVEALEAGNQLEDSGFA